jgi:hypothetical protein
MNKKFQEFIKGIDKLLPNLEEGMSLDMRFQIWGEKEYNIQTLGFPQKLRVFDYSTGMYYFVEKGEIVSNGLYSTI